MTDPGSEKWVAWELWFLMTIVCLHRLKVLAKEIARACMFQRMIGNTAPDLNGHGDAEIRIYRDSLPPAMPCGNVELSAKGGTTMPT